MSYILRLQQQDQAIFGMLLRGRCPYQTSLDHPRWSQRSFFCLELGQPHRAFARLKKMVFFVPQSSNNAGKDSAIVAHFCGTNHISPVEVYAMGCHMRIFLGSPYPNWWLKSKNTRHVFCLFLLLEITDVEWLYCRQPDYIMACKPLMFFK